MLMHFFVMGSKKMLDQHLVSFVTSGKKGMIVGAIKQNFISGRIVRQFWFKNIIFFSLAAKNLHFK